MVNKTFFCIDAHTCGNPVRLVAGGGPLLPDVSMQERRRLFMKEFDWVRRGLMFEPRGHDLMSGSILYPPHDPLNDIGILFIETSGCLPMCGHGTIGSTFNCFIEGLTSVGNHTAIIPSIEGWAKVTGTNTITIDEADDPFAFGFTVK